MPRLTVIKVGGGEGIDYQQFCEDLSGHRDYVLVHGGSARLNEVSTMLGHPPRFVTSVSGHESRFTDRRTMEMFNMVYAGYANKMIVEILQRLGVNAIGLTGIDGRLVEGDQKGSLKVIEDGRKKVLRGDLSGIIRKVNVGLLELLLDNGYVPVLTPPAISKEGVAINVDGDRFAAHVAMALKAEQLLLLSNVPGLLQDVGNEGSLIPSLEADQLDEFIETVALGRMKKKLLGAKESLEGGVSRVMLGDARGASPVTDALSGKGTAIS
jgi:[amino group carrier protein]-L-2-aminoadipate/L-glutamate 6-kinase